jgi:hypothetical protein
MSVQLNIFEGKKRRNAGMQRAQDKADKKNPGWSEAAYEFLKDYAKLNAKFMAEDVRFAAQGIEALKVENQKAWGSVIQRGVREGIIHNNNSEYRKVKNANANCTPAAVWKSLIYQYQKKAV